MLELHAHQGSEPAYKKKFGMAVSEQQGQSRTGSRYLVEVEGVAGEAAEGEWIVLGST